MAVPSTFADLSTTPASNSGLISDATAVNQIDNHLQSVYALIASIYANSGNGWSSPYLTATNPSYTGTLTGGTGVVNLGSGQFYKDGSGNVGIGRTPATKLDVNGAFSLSILTSVAAATYTLLATDSTLRVQVACVLTLPAASSFPGRRLRVMNVGAASLDSASSDVVPQGGSATGTAILAASSGRWAEIESNGTAWWITASN